MLHTTSLSILLNGSMFDTIILGKGICQGDLLSPFLFVIMIELLSRVLHKLKLESKIHGIKIACTSPSISHLFSIDDAMIFLIANSKDIGNVV